MAMPRSRQLILELGEKPSPRLNNFIVGHNAEAFASLVHAIEPGARERMIYLWGEAGVGKTHLLQAVAHQARTCGLVVHTFASGELPSSVPDADCYCLDDMQVLEGEAWVAAFNLFNRARELGRVFISAGRMPPQALQVAADLRSRLAWGLVYEVHRLDDEEKRDVLRNHGIARGLTLTDAVLDYLMQHWPRDLGHLIAAVELLDRYSMATKRAVTLPVLRELLDAGPVNG